MDDEHRQPITLLLQQVNEGDKDAEADLLRLVYRELQVIASDQIRRLGPGQTLQATALVNEAYLKLATGTSDWDGRAHFFGAAARAMRNIIVDQLRRKSTIKHGGENRRVELDSSIAERESIDPDHVLDIATALHALEKIEPRAAKVVDFRFFVGLSDIETAEVMAISVRTVYREWSYAKAWLRRELADSCMIG